jgi:hypothetical protein
MRHSSREEIVVQRLLRATRTIAVVGASPRPERASRFVQNRLALALKLRRWERTPDAAPRLA